MNSGEVTQFFSPAIIFTILLLITGVYCVIATKNFIRVIIGLEIITKAVTLLIIFSGYLTGRVALAQSLAITLIIIEVVIMVVAAGIIIGVSKQTGSLDVRNLRNLKG